MAAKDLVIIFELTAEEAEQLLTHAMMLMEMPGGSLERIMKAMALAVDFERYSAVIN